MRSSTAGRRPAVLLLVVLLALLAACGRRGDPLEIGLKRVSLDLAFKAEEAPKPVTPQQLPVEVDAVAEFAILEPTFDEPERPTFASQPLNLGNFAFPDPCPTAAADAVADQPVTVAINQPAAMGTYIRRVEGTFALKAGLLNLQGAMPPIDQLEYKDLTPGSKDVYGFGTLQPVQPYTVTKFTTHTFTVEQKILDNYIRNTFRIENDHLLFLQREIKVGDNIIKFAPRPEISFMPMGVGEGNVWSDGGTDPDTGTSMTINGRILQRELVDVCGKVYDTYRVEITENVANLRSGFASRTKNATSSYPCGGNSTRFLCEDVPPPPESEQTPSGKPNIYNIATQLGGLFLREETHSITQAGTLVVEFDTVSTFTSAQPGGRLF